MPYEAPASQRADDDGDDTLNEQGRRADMTDDHIVESLRLIRELTPP